MKSFEKTKKINDAHEFHCLVSKCCQKGPRSSPGALQRPLGRTMGLQDNPKSSPRDHQESSRGLQELSESAPEGLKRLPRAVQIVARSPYSCQEGSQSPEGSSKRPARGHLDHPKKPQSVSSSSSTHFQQNSKKMPSEAGCMGRRPSDNIMIVS